MFEHLGRNALDYAPCHYGGSRLVFRGPKRDLDQGYGVVIGGTEAFGKFVEQPFPDLIDTGLGRTVLNLGVVNAGVQSFLAEPAISDLVKGAEFSIVQVMGAPFLDNPFYRVHPRRNDRFLRATPALKSLYPRVDFTEFTFVRHLLARLRSTSPRRFEQVVGGLQVAWLSAMRDLVGTLGGKTVLLILDGVRNDPSGLGRDPLFISDAMLAEVSALFDEHIHVRPKVGAVAALKGMIFNDLERPAAQYLPDTAAHLEIAQAILPVLRRK